MTQHAAIASSPAPPAAAPRAARRPTGRRWLLVAGLAVAAWLTWPVLTLTPGPGIDPSYGYALTEATREGLAFGKDIVFTYGPLGFLTAPSLWWGPAAAGALAAVGLVHLGWCAVVWVAARRHLPRGAAIAVLAATMWLSTMLPGNETGAAAEILAIGLALAGLLVVQRPPGRPWALATVAVGCVLGAVTALEKFDSGLLAAGVVVVTAGALAKRWWSGAAAGLAGTTAAVAVLWAATGQPLGNLPSYFGRSLQMALGWGDALRYEAPGSGWQYPVAALLTLAIVAAYAAGPTRRSVATWLIVAGVLAVGFKHGFVRHDAHAVEFFLVTVVVLLGAPKLAGPPRAAWLVSVLAALVVVGVVGSPVRPSLAQWAQGAGRLVGQVVDLASPSHQRQVQASGRAAIRAYTPVPPAALALLRGRGVQVEPLETSLAWAYRLRWQPAPVFQTNMIDEHPLDELMASSLSGPRAPQAILRRRGVDVEDVPQPWDGPAYRLAELCDYRVAYIDPTWEVLLKAAPRCGKPSPAGREGMTPGVSVPVPRAPAGDLVTASIELPTPGLPTRIHDFLYKPSTSLRLSAGDYSGTVFRGTAIGPLVVSVPPYDNPGADWPQARTITLYGFSGRGEVTFSAVPISGRP